ncbi:vanZ like family protein [Clostridium sporogenes]|uniref:VanZ family protein n=1 Tax=Clostridium TaxID=1485 RepID=UPI0009096B09|nr:MULTISPECIES: VanZ family protein [Clostridium]APF28907.1 vanZ like family protein [Clostridium sporogenes]MDI6919591.1 VanZ family protein [Clostridium botulinum]WMU96841.1 VanZ family protein [Clostridium botulinum]
MQGLVRDMVIPIIINGIIILILSKINKKQQNKTGHIIGVLFFTFIMTAIFSLTGVSPISGFHTDIRINEISYIPVVSTLEMVKDVFNTASVENIPRNQAMLFLGANILGNILMFGPLGLLLPLLWKSFRKFSKTVLFGFVVSFTIEFSQLFLARGTDIDDLILNTIGTMLGYLAFVILCKLFSKFTEKFTLQDGIEKSSWNILPASSVIIPYLVIVAFGFYDRAILFAR